VTTKQTVNLVNACFNMKFYLPNWGDYIPKDSESKVDQESLFVHELQTEPDGHLLSKAFFDSNKKERNKMISLGVHKYLRTGKKVIGDCGAFSYINEAFPKIKLEDLVEYYDYLGFDYGVSLDHIIHNGLTEEEKVLRWHITKRNNMRMINLAKNSKFKPMAVIQGFSLESYQEMFWTIQDCGYEYIAIGGLTRKGNKAIIEILEEIDKIRKKDTKIHCFGVARTSILEDYKRLNVTSADSASVIRQSFLGNDNCYYNPVNYGVDKNYSSIKPDWIPRNAKEERLVKDEPWKKCNCKVCLEHGKLICQTGKKFWNYSRASHNLETHLKYLRMVF